MSEIDIWGAVIPAWLGGVGGVAAAVVSTIALIKSLKTQGGVETLKGAANQVSEGSMLPSVVMASPNVPNAGVLPTATLAAPPEQSPVSWTSWHEAKNRYRLRNDSTQNGAAATLTGFEDVTPGGDGAATYRGSLPVELAAGETVPFTIDKSLVGPSVTAIALTWVDNDGTERHRTLYI